MQTKRIPQVAQKRKGPKTGPFALFFSLPAGLADIVGETLRHEYASVNTRVSGPADGATAVKIVIARAISGTRQFHVTMRLRLAWGRKFCMVAPVA
jgi:hypothetical protein